MHTQIRDTFISAHIKSTYYDTSVFKKLCGFFICLKLKCFIRGMFTFHKKELCPEKTDAFPAFFGRCNSITDVADIAVNFLFLPVCSNSRFVKVVCEEYFLRSESRLFFDVKLLCFFIGLCYDNSFTSINNYRHAVFHHRDCIRHTQHSRKLKGSCQNCRV